MAPAAVVFWLPNSTEGGQTLLHQHKLGVTSCLAGTWAEHFFQLLLICWPILTPMHKRKYNRAPLPRISADSGPSNFVEFRTCWLQHYKGKTWGSAMFTLRKVLGNKRQLQNETDKACILTYTWASPALCILCCQVHTDKTEAKLACWDLWHMCQTGVWDTRDSMITGLLVAGGPRFVVLYYKRTKALPNFPLGRSCAYWSNQHLSQWKALLTVRATEYTPINIKSFCKGTSCSPLLLTFVLQSLNEPQGSVRTKITSNVTQKEAEFCKILSFFFRPKILRY